GRNFGDQLGPALLRHFGVEVEWAPPDKAELVTVGSILSKVPNGWTGTVLGTGFIRAGIARDLRQARVLAVRGAYTRRAARGASGAILGDPGVLIEDLFPGLPERARDYELVLPHYVDHDLAARHRGARAASIAGDPREMLEAIAG